MRLLAVVIDNSIHTGFLNSNNSSRELERFTNYVELSFALIAIHNIGIF